MNTCRNSQSQRPHKSLPSSTTLSLQTILLVLSGPAVIGQFWLLWRWLWVIIVVCSFYFSNLFFRALLICQKKEMERETSGMIFSFYQKRFFKEFLKIYILYMMMPVLSMKDALPIENRRSAVISSLPGSLLREWQAWKEEIQKYTIGYGSKP